MKSRHVTSAIIATIIAVTICLSLAAAPVSHTIQRLEPKKQMLFFGQKIAMSDDIAVIAGLNAVSIFERDESGRWEEKKRWETTGSSFTDTFGYSVAVSGDNVAIASLFGGPDQGGCVHVYRRSSTGKWKQEATLAPQHEDRVSRGGGNFGSSTALSGDTLVIGARLEREMLGSAYIYRRKANKTWTQVAKLSPEDIWPESLFGRSVDIFGKTVIVGASGHRDNRNENPNSGKAYLFEEENGSWRQTERFVVDDAIVARFGVSTAIGENIAVVGSQSEIAFVYEKNTDGKWSLTERLTSGQATGDSFGQSVAVSQNTILVGAHTDNRNGELSGTAYRFNRGGSGTWSRSEIKRPPEADEGMCYGENVAIFNGTCLIGAVNFEVKEDNPSLPVRGGAAFILQDQATYSDTTDKPKQSKPDPDQGIYSDTTDKPTQSKPDPAPTTEIEVEKAIINCILDALKVWGETGNCEKVERYAKILITIESFIQDHDLIKQAVKDCDNCPKSKKLFIQALVNHHPELPDINRFKNLLKDDQTNTVEDLLNSLEMWGRIGSCEKVEIDTKKLIALKSFFEDPDLILQAAECCDKCPKSKKVFLETLVEQYPELPIIKLVKHELEQLQ